MSNERTLARRAGKSVAMVAAIGGLLTLALGSAFAHSAAPGKTAAVHWGGPALNLSFGPKAASDSSEPDETDGPDETEAPEATDAPEATERPEKTEKPDATENDRGDNEDAQGDDDQGAHAESDDNEHDGDHAGDSSGGSGGASDGGEHDGGGGDD